MLAVLRARVVGRHPDGPATDLLLPSLATWILHGADERSLRYVLRGERVDAVPVGALVLKADFQLREHDAAVLGDCQRNADEFRCGLPRSSRLPDGCSCTANLGNPTNRRTFAWTWPGEPQPYDFIAGIVPAGPGETAARFVVTNKGECTTQTSISGVYSLDGGRTKQPLQLIAPAGGTQELLLPIPAGDACAQTCTLWYTVIEFLPNGQQPSVNLRPMTIPLVQSPECRRFRDAFAVEEPFDFVAEAGATAIIERRLPGPEWTGRWEFSSDSYAPNTPLADGPRPGGSVLSGTSTPRLEISGCTSADVGIYFLRVTPPGGTPADEFVESSALLRVDTQYPSCPPLPSFTREPADATLPEGGSLVTLDYALGGPPTNYGFDVLVQWYVDGVPVDDGPHTTASGVSMQIGDANTFGIGEKTLSLNSIAFPKGMADRSFRVQCEIVRTGPDYQCTWGTFIRSFERTVSVRSCAADLDGSGTVDAADLSTLLSNWGEAAGDVDGDGDTDASDLSVMLSSWGECAG